MNLREQQEQLTEYLKKISPEQSLEALRDSESKAETLESAIDAERAERADRALERMISGENLDEREMIALEAIILPGERPVLDVRGGEFSRPMAPFKHFDREPIRGFIEAAIPSVGRIDVPDAPHIPYAGTGFIVGPELLMTNRHVAEIFTIGLGRERLRFRNGYSPALDLVRETTDQDAHYVRIRDVAMVHPYWDMALLIVDGLPKDATPLELSVTAPEDMLDDEIAVIGYPALDPRNNVELQNDIFRGQFNIKRVQPGMLRQRSSLRSFGKSVSAVTHDSSTLGGNSGSAVVNIETGHVIALHFAGIYKKENYAVPTWELAQDPWVVDSGLNFVERPSPGPAPWQSYWDNADESVSPQAQDTTASAATPVATTGGGSSHTWTIPLQLTINVGTPTSVVASIAGRTQVEAEAEIEKVPVVDTNYQSRTGYDPDFLDIPVPIPTITDEAVLSHMDNGESVVPYEHFSLAMHRQRRLALFIAGNIDKRDEKKEPEPGRDYSRRALNGFTSRSSENWLLDPRIPATHQLPDRFFTKDNQAFDKGHLFRREAATWGDSYAQVQRANGDTFHVTNCSPQIAGFNRSNRHGIWGKLENLVGKSDDERMIVLAGPVLDQNDGFFTGVDDDGVAKVQIPSRFWKIVVVNNNGALESYAFMLEQDLTDVPLEFTFDASWKDKTISIAALEKELGIVDFGEAVREADQFESNQAG